MAPIDLERRMWGTSVTLRMSQQKYVACTALCPLLQALGEGDVNSDGTIEVTGLAGSVDKAVPEISYAAFNLRQIPQMSIIGSDFPIASQIRVLSAETPPASTPATDIPTSPTHVVIAATKAHKAPEETSGIIQSLGTGVAVTVLETSGEWTLVGRGGIENGYVHSDSLVTIQ